jgi:hypothetical protein
MIGGSKFVWSAAVVPGFPALHSPLSTILEAQEVTNLKNELPVAVHHASGGDARVRVGGNNISLNNISSGSFQMTNATRFKVFANLRSGQGILILVGYTTPITLSNASGVVIDMGTIIDDAPDGSAVYFSILDPMSLTPTPGGADDYLYVSLYG